MKLCTICVAHFIEHIICVVCWMLLEISNTCIAIYSSVRVRVRAFVACIKIDIVVYFKNICYCHCRRCCFCCFHCAVFTLTSFRRVHKRKRNIHKYTYQKKSFRLFVLYTYMRRIHVNVRTFFCRVVCILRYYYCCVCVFAWSFSDTFKIFIRTLTHSHKITTPNWRKIVMWWIVKKTYRKSYEI